MEEHKITRKEAQIQRREEKKMREETERMQKKSSNRKLFTIIIVSAIVIIAGLTWLIQNRPESSITPDTTAEINPVSEIDQIKGGDATTSKVTLVEYSDFQCSACGAYYPIVKQLIEDFDTDIQFVYRHFPLFTIHANADISARAAESAGAQGKFWEMHDLLFENQQTWSTINNPKKTFVGYAEQIGLDIDKFTADLNSKEIGDKVESDRLDGLNAGVNSTPSFFLDGVKMKNPQSLEEFSAAINKAIADKAI